VEVVEEEVVNMKTKTVVLNVLVGSAFLLNACGNGSPNPMLNPINGHGTGTAAPANTPLNGKWTISGSSPCTGGAVNGGVATGGKTASSFYSIGYFIFNGNMGEFNDLTLKNKWEYTEFSVTYGPNNTVTLSNFLPPQCSSDGNNYSSCNKQPPTAPITYQYQLASGSTPNSPSIAQTGNLNLISVSQSGNANPGFNGAQGFNPNVNAGPQGAGAYSAFSPMSPAATDSLACGDNFTVPYQSNLTLI
jgi:hypothetical protein